MTKKEKKFLREATRVEWITDYTLHLAKELMPTWSKIEWNYNEFLRRSRQCDKIIEKRINKTLNLFFKKNLCQE